MTTIRVFTLRVLYKTQIDVLYTANLTYKVSKTAPERFLVHKAPEEKINSAVKMCN